jgi:hypothetical protein
MAPHGAFFDENAPWIPSRREEGEVGFIKIPACRNL